MIGNQHIVRAGLAAAATGLLIAAVTPSAPAATPALSVPTMIAPEPVPAPLPTDGTGTECSAGRFAANCEVPDVPGPAGVPAPAQRAMAADLAATSPTAPTRTESLPASDIPGPPAARRALDAELDD